MFIFKSAKSLIGLMLTFMMKDYFADILMCKVDVYIENDYFVFVNQFYISVETYSLTNKLHFRFVESDYSLTISFQFVNSSDPALVSATTAEEGDSSSYAPSKEEDTDSISEDADNFSEDADSNF